MESRRKIGCASCAQTADRSSGFSTMVPSISHSWKSPGRTTMVSPCHLAAGAHSTGRYTSANITKKHRKQCVITYTKSPGKAQSTAMDFMILFELLVGFLRNAANLRRLEVFAIHPARLEVSWSRVRFEYLWGARFGVVHTASFVCLFVCLRHKTRLNNI